MSVQLKEEYVKSKFVPELRGKVIRRWHKNGENLIEIDGQRNIVLHDWSVDPMSREEYILGSLSNLVKD